MRNQLIKFLPILLILGLTTVYSQTVITVINDSDSTLAEALDLASPGDILELTVDGVYETKDQLVLDQDITIRGSASLTNKPVIKYVGTATSAYMFKGVSSPRIALENLEFDGDGTAEGGAALAKYVVRLDNGDTLGTMSLFIDNCIAHDFNDKFIKPYGDCGMDSLVVTNSVFYNGESEGIVFYSGSSGDPAARIGYGEVSNSTFYNIERECIKADTYTDGTLFIDQITAYNCGDVDGKSIFYVDDWVDVTVQNSIFVLNNYASYCARLESSDNLFTNNVLWDMAVWDVDNATIVDTLRVDPGFADASNGDFTLPVGSMLLTYGLGGGIVGDPRWDPTPPEPVTWYIAAGTDVLDPVIDNAAPGDIIELISDGGLYLSADQMVIDKDITIRGASGLTSKPVLKYVGTATSAYMFKGVDSPRIALENLEFDGDGTAEGGAALAKYVVRLDNGDTTGTMSLFIDNCIAHDFNDKFIKPYGDCGMDSLVVTNSIFYNGESEGIVFYSGSSGDPAARISYGEVSNSTFYNIERECIKADTYTTGELFIDRITAYNCGDVDGKSIFYVDDWVDVTVQNSIFVLNNYASYCARLESSDNLFTNNVLWDMAVWDVDNATVVDTLRVDPGFADPTNGDFTLPLGSVLLTHATDAGAVGDSRWIPDPHVIWEVAAGTDVIETALDQAAPGDIIELTTSGGLYLNASQLVIDQDVTIRGASDLASKPVLKYVGTATSAYMFKGVGSPRIALENLEFDGDGTAEGGAALAKYVVRLDNGDTLGTMSLFMDNCIAHDFNDKFIKPYGNCGMDSLVVTNSVFYNGESEGIVFYSGSSGDPAVRLAYGEVSNSTFYDIERECIKADTYTAGELLIDRITVYNCGDVDGKSIFYVDDWVDVTVKNSIFVLNNYGSYCARLESADNLFTNNVLWEMAVWNVDNATIVDTLHVDPGFADPTNGDFSLPAGSPLYTFGDDGGHVGDSRWVPVGGQFNLVVTAIGGGSVALDPPGGSYDPGTVVTMTATADQFWLFDGWSPNVQIFPPDNPVATVTMTQNMAVDAYFIPSIAEYDVDISSIGYGHVADTLFSDYGTLDGYFEGDSLVMHAVVDSVNWEFAYWTDLAGDSIDNANPNIWIVDVDTSFTAMFRSTLTQYTLNMIIVGGEGGEVNVDPMPVPGFITYDAGTVVTLAAETELGWSFDGYTGDATGTADTLVVTMNSDLNVTATFIETPHPSGALTIDVSWDLLDAVEYAHNNSQVNTIVLSDLGPYQPTESQRDPSTHRMPQIDIESPVRIVADETLTEKPVIRGYTSSTGSADADGFFRFRAGSGTLELKNLIIDGYLDETTDAYPAKYIFRADDGSDTVFCSIKAYNVDFSNTVEAFWKNYARAWVDTMRFEDCQISNIGKEGLYLKAIGHVNYVGLKNTTFTKVARETIYLTAMPDAFVEIDHVTIAECGFGAGSDPDKHGAVRIENTTDVQIHNVIIYRVTNSEYGYALRFAGENSVLDNVLLFESAEEISVRDDATVGPDVFWYDPLFLGPDTGNFTLSDSSVAYHLANDGSAAIGDLRWATSTNVASYNSLTLNVGDHGDVTQDPLPMTKFYVPGTDVTLTAYPDTLYKFGEWTGDLTGTVSPATLAMDADKMVAASFAEAWYNVELNVNMGYWAFLGQFSFVDDSVDAAGNFNNFEGTWLADDDGDSVYTGTFVIDENFPDIEWKFRINGSWDDATCEFPYGQPNRMFTVTQDTSLTFWYNDDEPVVGVYGRYLPMEYALDQNYPNPFNPTTTINFALVNPGRTSLIIYDIMGRQVAKLIDRDMEAGYHSISFRENNMASGMYFYKLESGDFISIKKMIMMK